MADESEGTFDPYKPPLADFDAREPAVLGDEPAFYVVSLRKFVILFVGTLGLYSVVWFYWHWFRQRRVSGKKLSPALRAIFAIFFAYQLFAAIDRAARDAGKRYPWSPSLQAVVFVLLSVSAYFVDRIAKGAPVQQAIFTVAMALLPGIPLATAQHVANYASRDPLGQKNSTLGTGNVIWLVVGALFWVLTLWSYLSPE